MYYIFRVLFVILQKNLKLIYCLIKIDLIMGNSAYGKGAYDTAQKLTKEFNQKIQEKNDQTIIVGILSAIATGTLALLGLKK